MKKENAILWIIGAILLILLLVKLNILHLNLPDFFSSVGSSSSPSASSGGSLGGGLG